MPGRLCPASECARELLEWIPANPTVGMALHGVVRQASFPVPTDNARDCKSVSRGHNSVRVRQQLDPVQQFVTGLPLSAPKQHDSTILLVRCSGYDQP